MKKVIDGFISFKDYGSGGLYIFHMSKMDDYGYVTVMPYAIEVEIPDDFDPRAGQVEALKAEKKKLMADFQARCTEIERKISELTALTCEAA